MVLYYSLSSNLKHSRHVLIKFLISTLVINVDKGGDDCKRFINCPRRENFKKYIFIINIWKANLEFRHLIYNFCLTFYICTFVTFLSMESMCTASRTSSVKSVTFLVIAVLATGMLTVFTIRLHTSYDIWKGCLILSSSNM